MLQVHEPTSASLVVDASGPGAVGRINFHLVPVYPARRNLDLLALELYGLGLVEALAANLDAGVQAGINLEFQLEDEIGIMLFRAQERVRRVRYGGADKLAILHAVLRFAAAL